MKAKKSFGQHFLRDKEVVKRIATSLPVEDEQVVEIGPGTGALTEELVRRIPADRLTLVEADRTLVPLLKEKFPSVSIIQADAAKFDYPFSRWVLIGNLPYNAAAAILRQAFTVPNPPVVSVVMVQKEQADRMLALPGQTSMLSLAVQLYTESRRLFDVPPEAFSPKPKVQSTVLELKTKSGVDREKNERILQLAKTGFSARRKQLPKNLAAAGVASAEQVAEALIALGQNPKARAQELSLEDWRQLAEKIS